MRGLSRKECSKTNKGDMQPFENTLLFAMTFPKRGFFGKVTSLVYYGAVVPYRRFSHSCGLEPSALLPPALA